MPMSNYSGSNLLFLRCSTLDVGRSVFVAACVSLLAGCGGPKYVSVEGTVTLTDKPLTYKSVMFTPEEGTPGSGAGGYTNGEGKYSLTAIVYGITEDLEGVQPGRYRVTISESLIPLSEADFGPLETPDEAPEAILVETLENVAPSVTIPAAYTDKDTSPLVVDVSESGEVALDIKLKSNPEYRVWP